MKITFKMLTTAALATAFAITSCEKIQCPEKEKPKEKNLEGCYEGTFKVTYNGVYDSLKNCICPLIMEGNTTLEIKDGNYFCGGNANRIPAGGSGNFSNTKDSLYFNDINMWTADFDWGLILNGSYKYAVNGNKLKIWNDKTSVDGALYEYNFEKINCNEMPDSTQKDSLSPCMRQKIDPFNEDRQVCKGATIKEYLFQNQKVYCFDVSMCGADMTNEVFDINCNTLGFLGGIMGNSKINGLDFMSNATYIKTIYTKK